MSVIPDDSAQIAKVYAITPQNTPSELGWKAPDYSIRMWCRIAPDRSEKLRTAERQLVQKGPSRRKAERPERRKAQKGDFSRFLAKNSICTDLGQLVVDRQLWLALMYERNVNNLGYEYAIAICTDLCKLPRLE